MRYWASAIGVWIAFAHGAALLGLCTKRRAEIDLFNDNDYMWRNLLKRVSRSQPLPDITSRSSPILLSSFFKDVQIVYADEAEARRIVKMSRLPELVNGDLADDKERSNLTRFVANELPALRIKTGKFACPSPKPRNH